MGLVAEYDRYYTDNPNKWASVSHDDYIYQTLAPHGQPVSLLDVGCGNGHTLQYLSEKWRDVKYTGLDLSPVAIGLAKKRVPTATFICGEWEKADVGGFDMAIVVGVAEHFPDPLQGLKRLYDALEPSGIAYLEVPNCIAYPTSSGEEGYRRIEIGSRQIEWHLYRESWERLIEESGLSIINKITGPNIYMEFVWILERK